MFWNRKNKKKYNSEIDNFDTELQESINNIKNENFYFQYKRANNRYLLELDLLKTIKETDRFRLGILGVIGTVVIAAFFSVVSLNGIVYTPRISLLYKLIAFAFMVNFTIQFVSLFWGYVNSNKKMSQLISDNRPIFKDDLNEDIINIEKKDLLKCIRQINSIEGYVNEKSRRLDNTRGSFYSLIIMTICSMIIILITNISANTVNSSVNISDMTISDIPVSMPDVYGLSISIILLIIPILWFIISKLIYHINECKKQKSVVASFKDDNKRQITISELDSDSYYLTKTIDVTGYSTIPESKYVYIMLIKGSDVPKDYPNIDEERLLSLNNNNQKFLKRPVSNKSKWSARFDLSYLIGKIEGGEVLLLASPFPPSYNKSVKIKLPFVYTKINLKRPFLTATAESSILSPHNPVKINGIAITKLPYIYMWLCTENKLIERVPISVNKDDTYKFKLSYDSRKFKNGEHYFCIIQMPMTNEEGEVRLFEGDNPFIAKVDSYGKKDMSDAIILDDNNNKLALQNRIQNLIDRKDVSDIYVMLYIECRKDDE